MAAVLGFMDSPLVAWARTLSAGDAVDFVDLCDGVFFNDVLMTIDQRELLVEVNRAAKDSNAKIHNWIVLLRNIKSYYQDILQQVVVQDFIDVLSIVHEPTKESSIKALHGVLLLLLGCAVQCEQKERYIGQITRLDLHTQQAIVDYIKQVTDSIENVVSVDTLSEVSLQAVGSSLRRLAHDRDVYAESFLRVCQERDYYKAGINGKSAILTPPPSLESHHIYNELNRCKSDRSALTSKLEEKSKQLAESLDELESTKEELSKLKLKNLDLCKNARLSQAYRDELDMLKEKAAQTEKLEKEMAKYKDKINEIGFYKARVEDLREDNNVLMEAKNKIEEQLSSANKRAENVMDDLVRTQLYLEESNSEREQLQKKLQELIEENAVLEFEKNSANDGYRGGLRRVTSSSSELFTGSCLQLAGNPISEELNDSMSCKVTRLETENEALQQEVSETKSKLTDTQMEVARLKAAAERDYRKKMSELEQQTNELRRRTSSQLANDFHAKLQSIEKQNEEMKARLSSEHQVKVQQFERILLDKEKQMKFLKETKYKEKQALMEKEKQVEFLKQDIAKRADTIAQIQQASQARIKQLEQEVHQHKTTMAHLQNNSHARIRKLELELNKMRVEAENIKKVHKLSSPLHSSKLEKNLMKYIARETVRESINQISKKKKVPTATLR